MSSTNKKWQVTMDGEFIADIVSFDELRNQNAASFKQNAPYSRNLMSLVKYVGPYYIDCVSKSQYLLGNRFYALNGDYFNLCDYDEFPYILFYIIEGSNRKFVIGVMNTDPKDNKLYIKEKVYRSGPYRIEKREE